MTSIEKLEALNSSRIPFTIINGKLFGFGAKFNLRDGSGQGSVSSDSLETCIDRLWEACKAQNPDAPCFKSETVN